MQVFALAAAAGCSSAAVATTDSGVAGGDTGVAADVVSAADVPAGADVPVTGDRPAVTDGSTAGCFAVTRHCADITSTFPAGNANVSVTCDESAGTFTINATGVPNYTSNQTTPNAIASQGWMAVLPLNPGCSATHTDVVNSRGEIGFMVNGVPFYGPQDANGADAVVNEGRSFDDCLGHADMGCSYHYHEEPVCVFGVGDPASHHAQSDGHPAVIGYALDGFALHASYATGAAHDALDACNGHTDPVRGYHYHATPTAPYLLGCYAGRQTGRVVRSRAMCSTAGDGGMMVMPGDGGMMTMTGPRACTSTAGCTGACPPGSMGCACANSPMGMICVPSCNADGDCPTGTMMPLVCNTAMHVCVPRM